MVQSSGKLIIHLSHLTHDSVMSLLGIYPREMKVYVHTETYTQMFTAVLLKILKNRNKTKPKCPTTGEGINKLVHPYHGILLSHKK